MQRLPRADGLRHIRAKRHHPQTIDKVERWRRTVKDGVELLLHVRADELRRAIGKLVGQCNRRRYHEVYPPLARR